MSRQLLVPPRPSPEEAKRRLTFSPATAIELPEATLAPARAALGPLMHEGETTRQLVEAGKIVVPALIASLPAYAEIEPVPAS